MVGGETRAVERRPLAAALIKTGGAGFAFFCDFLAA